ncbi:EAL domain-containing protein [candidate division WOR-3 bacterium]|nr:EAL domain-containing protein [candidate division WOR-3 bacterium]
MKEDRSSYLRFKSALYDNEIDLPVYLLKLSKIRELIENMFQIGVIAVNLDTEYEELNGWELFDSKRYLLSIVLKSISEKYKELILSIFAVRSGTFILFFPFKEEKKFETFMKMLDSNITEYCNAEIFSDKYVEFAHDYLPLNKDLRIERLVESTIYKCLNRINTVRKEDYERGEEHLIKLLNEENITVYFQPIIDIENNSILAFEFLSRTNIAYFSNTDILFRINSNYKSYNKLESLCFKKIIDIIQEKQLPVKYSINFSSDYILHHLMEDKNIKRIIDRNDLMPSDFIIEITERSPIRDLLRFKHVIKTLKNYGFKIAIDDVGSGYSTLGMISEINPDYIKYDLKLIHDIDKMPIKRELLKSIINFAYEQNLTLIAEGVETKEEFETIKQLGVKYVQGYFFQTPTTDPQKILSKYAIKN